MAASLEEQTVFSRSRSSSPDQRFLGTADSTRDTLSRTRTGRHIPQCLRRYEHASQAPQVRFSVASQNVGNHRTVRRLFDPQLDFSRDTIGRLNCRKGHARCPPLVSFRSTRFYPYRVPYASGSKRRRRKLEKEASEKIVSRVEKRIINKYLGRVRLIPPCTHVGDCAYTAVCVMREGGGVH